MKKNNVELQLTKKFFSSILNLVVNTTKKAAIGLYKPARLCVGIRELPWLHNKKERRV